MSNEPKRFCDTCNKLTEKCVCYYFEPVDPDFKFEYAHEIGSYEKTQYKKIYPQYD